MLLQGVGPSPRLSRQVAAAAIDAGCERYRQERDAELPRPGEFLRFAAIARRAGGELEQALREGSHPPWAIFCPNVDRDRFLADLATIVRAAKGVPADPGGKPNTSDVDENFVAWCVDVFTSARGNEPGPTTTDRGPFHQFVLACAAHALGEDQSEVAYLSTIRKVLKTLKE